MNQCDSLDYKIKEGGRKTDAVSDTKITAKSLTGLATG